MATHTLSVLVENSPGVLARIASLFSRRGYNIDSLAVGPTENSEISRMTIVLNLDGHALDQVIAQLFKLINVIGISEMTDTDSIKREALLVKLNAQKSDREKVAAVAQKYNGVIVDESDVSLTIEATGPSTDIEALLKSLEQFGIKELVQSGLIALERGSVTLAERTLSTSGVAISDSHSATADYQN